MGQNVGDWAKNDEKSKKGNKKTKKKKKFTQNGWFLSLFSNRGKWRAQAFIEGLQTPPSPLLYHHLSQKKKKK